MKLIEIEEQIDTIIERAKRILPDDIIDITRRTVFYNGDFDECVGPTSKTAYIGFEIRVALTENNDISATLETVAEYKNGEVLEVGEGYVLNEDIDQLSEDLSELCRTLSAGDCAKNLTELYERENRERIEFEQELDRSYKTTVKRILIPLAICVAAVIIITIVRSF